MWYFYIQSIAKTGNFGISGAESSDFAYTVLLRSATEQLSIALTARTKSWVMNFRTVELWARNPLEAEVFVKFNMTQGLISKS